MKLWGNGLLSGLTWKINNRFVMLFTVFLKKWKGVPGDTKSFDNIQFLSLFGKVFLLENSTLKLLHLVAEIVSFYFFIMA